MGGRSEHDVGGAHYREHFAGRHQSLMQFDQCRDDGIHLRRRSVLQPRVVDQLRRRRRKRHRQQRPSISRRLRGLLWRCWAATTWATVTRR